MTADTRRTVYLATAYILLVNGAFQWEEIPELTAAGIAGFSALLFLGTYVATYIDAGLSDDDPADPEVAQ